MGKWIWKMVLVVIICHISSACIALPTPAVLIPTATAPYEPDCNWVEAFPTQEAQIVWPSLLPTEIEEVAPGDHFEITASGGYLQWDNECGVSINESAREFQLFIDGEPSGNISCYVNVCRMTLSIPVDTPPGTHTLSVEGGSSLDFEVIDR